MPDPRSGDDGLARESVAAVMAAREEGFREGQTQASAQAARASDELRSAVTSAVQGFARQQAEYFRHIEVEAVRLALAIARKVLNREASADPLLLAGIVRVALDQMQSGTRIVLRASTEEVPSWRRFCADHVKEGQEIEVVADDALTNHSCTLEADSGTAEISVEGELKEIEAGFFDRWRGKTATT